MLQNVRPGWQQNWTDIDNRQAIEPNGEMTLYFVLNNPTHLLNRIALEFHKVACLIWRLAGGAEPDEYLCLMILHLDYRNKEIQRWREDSSANLNADILS